MTSMLRVEKSVRRANANKRSRKVEPSGNGVNLLKSGMITAGAISIKSNWNAITTAAAQIHQFGPVHSISFKINTSNGNPSSTASENPLRRSSTHVFTVLVLKPNRSSSLNCAYHANGKLMMLSANPVAKRKAAIAQTDVPKAVVNSSNADGNKPLNRIAMRSAVSNNVTTSPNRLLASV